MIYDGNFLQEFDCTSGGNTAAPGPTCNNNTFFRLHRVQLRLIELPLARSAGAQ